jgi:hypothetical protein
MTTEKKVSPIRKATTNTVAAASSKTTEVKKPVNTNVTRSTSTVKPSTKTKVTRTQVRKIGSPSTRNKASQAQVNVAEKLKLSKHSMERDSFTMPKDEYAQLGVLKLRLAELGQPVKKSELLRAGIKLLAGMTDARLKTTMAAIPVIKTGRPKKKK